MAQQDDKEEPPWPNWLRRLLFHPDAVALQLHRCCPLWTPLSSTLLTQWCVPWFESLVFQDTEQVLSLMGRSRLLILRGPRLHHALYWCFSHDHLHRYCWQHEQSQRRSFAHSCGVLCPHATQCFGCGFDAMPNRLPLHAAEQLPREISLVHMERLLRKPSDQCVFLSLGAAVVATKRGSPCSKTEPHHEIHAWTGFPSLTCGTTSTSSGH